MVSYVSNNNWNINIFGYYYIELDFCMVMFKITYIDRRIVSKRKILEECFPIYCVGEEKFNRVYSALCGLDISELMGLEDALHELILYLQDKEI